VFQPSDPANFNFKPDVEPVATVAPGTRCLIDTEDAFSHQIAKPGDRRDHEAQPYGNPLTGPLWVSGAELGDTISIRIHAIECRGDTAATYAYPLASVMEYLGPDVVPQDRCCQVDEAGIHWDDGLVLPYRPMIGTVGTTPAGWTPTSGAVGAWGGNMDLVEVGPGSTLELPVFLEGGRLYFGDCHGLQGAAEWSGAAMEMRGRIDCTIELRKSSVIPGPRITTNEAIWAVGTARSIERGIAQAYSRLALWIEAEHGRPRWDAYCLLTQVGHLSFGYHGLGVVAAGIEHHYLQ